jgi:DNA integrity scanning protein DisA with diadenylate cyclase activity
MLSVLPLGKGVVYAQPTTPTSSSTSITTANNSNMTSPTISTNETVTNISRAEAATIHLSPTIKTSQKTKTVDVMQILKQPHPLIMSAGQKIIDLEAQKTRTQIDQNLTELFKSQSKQALTKSKQ